MTRRTRLGAARGSSSPGARRSHQSAFSYVDTSARVRSGARAVAPHQGSRHAGEPAVATGTRVTEKTDC